MNNEQIRTVYTDANAQSHTQALRAVYEAGRNHDKWAVSERRRLEDERVVALAAKTSETRRVAEEKRVADERLTPEQKQLAEDQRKVDEARVAEDKKVADEKKEADEKRAASDKALEAERLAKLKEATGGGPNEGMGTIRPTQAERATARAEALALARAQGLDAVAQMKAGDAAQAALEKRVADEARG